jgi:LysM repeat protein
MNPALLSANLSLAFLPVAFLALLAHLSHLAAPNRLIHLFDAAIAAGLVYLFGSRALGWAFMPREALLGLYALIFVAVAAVSIQRKMRGNNAGFASGSMLTQSAAMAYVFGPLDYWKPIVSGLLVIYFGLELLRWLAGTEQAVEQREETDHRPPLFPPKRVRGRREIALAGVAAAFVYLFVTGMGRTPPSLASQESADAQNTASAPAESGAAPSDETATSNDARGGAEANANMGERGSVNASDPAAAAPQQSAGKNLYTAAAGDTLKSVAKKLYGKPEKWRALAAANPGLKPATKLKAGQAISVPK